MMTMLDTKEIIDRELQKDRELERVRAENVALEDLARHLHHALHNAVRVIRARGTDEENEALAELIVGYPPAEHTSLVFLPVGTVIDKQAYALRRKS